MTPAKFTVIPFQQPNTLMCPACGFTSGTGPGITFKQNVGQINAVNVDGFQCVCTRCQYGSGLEWLMATE